MSFIRFSAVTVFSVILLAGCSVSNLIFRPDINQGNFITQKEVDTLSIGMTKEQVLFVMGTPMLTPIYEDNVWYYIFRELPTHKKVSQQTYIITFDDQDKVIDIKHYEFGSADLKQMDHTGNSEFIDGN